MFRVNLDMNYGVQRLDDAAMLKMDTCVTAPSMFHGIPVEFSDHITREVIRRKRWKRLGRPDKVRTRVTQAPAVIIMDRAKLKALDFPSTDPIIYMHPKLKPVFFGETS